MAVLTTPRFVDVQDPALAIECPACGLVTARFLPYCTNCGRGLWPSSSYASAAFRLWQEADPRRAEARRFDLELPDKTPPPVIDYDERARSLGIHVFPNSNWPFIICLGLFFLAFAAVPLPTVPRIVLAVVGALIFLTGVVGWVVVEDQRIYPYEETASDQERQEEAH